jgi:signal transduction histidine kinase
MLTSVLRLVRHATRADFTALCRIAADGIAHPQDCMPEGGLTGPFPARGPIGEDLLPKQIVSATGSRLPVAPGLDLAGVLVLPLNAGALLVLGWRGAAPTDEALREILPDAVAAIGTMLTGERERQTVTRQRNRIQAIISTIQEGIVVQPEDGGPALLNPTAALWLGVPVGSAGGDVLAAKMVEIARGSQSLPLLTGQEGPVEPQYLEWQAPDGTALLITLHPIAGRGGWLWVMERTAETKRTEWLRAQTLELQRMAGELEGERRRAIAAKTQADEANRSKSQFLATMSHELRTPLNAIIGFSELIRSDLHGDGISQRYRGYLDDIHTSGLHLLSLINDILDLSKIEAGKMEPHIEEFEPRELLDVCIKLVKGMAHGRRVAIVREAPDDLKPMRADRRMAKQVIVNLLSNAIKFSEANQPVVIRMTQDPRGTTAHVIDQGIGMRPEDIETALEPFGQVNADLARGQMGTGLGLPLAKSLMELHGGWLTIDSAPGQGTACTIFFPAGTRRAA